MHGKVKLDLKTADRTIKKKDLELDLKLQAAAQIRPVLGSRLSVQL